MYAAIAFALLSVASAQLSSYSSFPGVGINPIADQYPVQSLGLNAGAIQHYGSPYAGVQKVVSAPAFYGAQKAYAQKAYVDNAQVERDFNIESIGERYAINNGPSQLQYSFVRGNEGPHAYAQKLVAPQAYGAYGVPQVYGAGNAFAHLRAAPVVQKVYAGKQFY